MCKDWSNDFGQRLLCDLRARPRTGIECTADTFYVIQMSLLLTVLLWKTVNLASWINICTQFVHLYSSSLCVQIRTNTKASILYRSMDISPRQSNGRLGWEVECHGFRQDHYTLHFFLLSHHSSVNYFWPQTKSLFIVFQSGSYKAFLHTVQMYLLVRVAQVGLNCVQVFPVKWQLSLVHIADSVIYPCGHRTKETAKRISVSGVSLKGK